jgi:hypothetical protein
MPNLKKLTGILCSGLLLCGLFASVPVGRAAPGGKPAARPAGKEAKPDPVKAIKCDDGGVNFLPREIDLVCQDEHRDCEIEIPLLAKNCTKDFLEFVKLEMLENGRRSLVLEFSPASIVPPNAAWQEKIPWTTPGDLEAIVYYRPVGSGDPSPVRAAIKVKNAKLEKAKAACQECGGTWGRYGVNHKEGCNCKTKDAGKRCMDGDECQGQCMFDGYDQKGAEVGHCSDEARVTGCKNIVQKGQSKFPPRNPPPRKLPTCLD